MPKSKSRPAYGCTIKQLPKSKLAKAAALAVAENPANAPAAGLVGLAMTAFDVGSAPDLPAFIGVLTTKYWGAKGVDLPVAFLESAGTDLKERILSHLNAWGDRANVRFRLTDQPGSAVVRITRSAGGYWSYLGTDCKLIPKGEATMCLQGFTMQTAESEYKRVVRHEAGHTLGFPHEHMRRAIVARLDEAKTIAYFGRTQGWSADQVRQQVLTPLEETALYQPTAPDETSIMSYQLPAEITRDGRPVPGGLDINDADAGYAAKIYPAADAPPGPVALSNIILNLTFSNSYKNAAGEWVATVNGAARIPK